MGSSEHIKRLREELATSIRLGDDEGVRRAYQHLLRAGQPRKEIMDEVIYFATSSQFAPQPAPVKPTGPVPAMEETGSAARTAKGRWAHWRGDPPVDPMSEEERELFRKGVGVLLTKLRARKARARNVPDSSAVSAQASEERPSDASSDLRSAREGGRVIG